MYSQTRRVAVLSQVSGIDCSEPIHLSAVAVYLSTIPFSGVPLDMAMRYLLLHLPLPKEQGAIYRLLELFARRYHICNPSLWDTHDQILVVCYSILMLNTDAWNTNNKIKMTREQYVKNTSGQGVSEDILSVYPFLKLC
jgi:Sec7-like guanine-nucleotide exchange factor